MPPFLVGASAAVAAEVAAAVLVYSGPGLVRSLTAVLAASALALAFGLWSAPTEGLDRLRRRWVFALFAFMIATGYVGAWSMVDALGRAWWGQGVGLAVLAGLPMYAAGTVLGGLASAEHATGSRGLGVGAAAAFGAAVGAVLTGALLPRTPMPASVLISCMVMLSLGGMVFGALSDTSETVVVRDERGADAGVVRVEDRTDEMGERERRFILEGGHVRRRLTLSDGRTTPWDVALARALMPGPEDPWRILAVGAGVSSLAQSMTREHVSCTIDVLERSPDVVALGREHFDTDLEAGASDRVRLGVGNLEDLVKAVRNRYDLVLVDSAALGPLGGGRGLSREARGRLVQAVGTGGVLAWGPTAPEPGLPELAETWHRMELERSVDGEREVVVIMTPAPEESGRRSSGARLPPAEDARAERLASDGFSRRNGDASTQ